MKTLIQSLKQSLIGTLNLTVLVLAPTLYSRTILYNPYYQIICSLVLGIYIAYLNYKITTNQARSLIFMPTGIYKEYFNALISECGLDPQLVRVRYGYCGQAVAMTLNNTLCIDPLIWHGIGHDAEAIKAHDIIVQHVIPGLSKSHKDHITHTKNIFNEPAQRFVFKHELGHIYHNYFLKRILVIGITGCLAVLIGILAGVASAPYLGVFAVIIGMLSGYCADLFFAYASNIFFKFFQEKSADYFAVRNSCSDDIKAAARFFEQHQQLHNELYTDSFIGKIPSFILSGHPDGKSRSMSLTHRR